MATVEHTDLAAYCLDVSQRAKKASVDLAQVSGGKKKSLAS